MAKKSLFDVLALGPQTSDNTKKAYDWYRTQVRKMVVPLSRAQLLGQRKPLTPGGMFLFAYDPKTKEDLPYYDTQPLILCFRIEADRFWGINLHYLKPEERAIILRELMAIAGSNFHQTHKMKLSWGLLGYYVKTKLLNHAVKQYLFDHVVIAPVMIDAAAWKMSIFLPTESFVKAHRSTIWKDF